ncbi:hypothetical protein [Citrobacter amalonaticus]
MKSKNINIVRNNRQVLHAKLAPTCFATMLALGMIMPAHAAVVAGNTNQPGIHTNANGTCRFNWSTQQLCENMGLRRFFE